MNQRREEERRGDGDGGGGGLCNRGWCRPVDAFSWQGWNSQSANIVGALAHWAGWTSTRHSLSTRLTHRGQWQSLGIVFFFFFFNKEQKKRRRLINPIWPHHSMKMLFFFLLSWRIILARHFLWTSICSRLKRCKIKFEKLCCVLVVIIYEVGWDTSLKVLHCAIFTSQFPLRVTVQTPAARCRGAHLVHANLFVFASKHADDTTGQFHLGRWKPNRGLNML